MKDKIADSSSSCEAEQVHISLGNEINSVLVNFASNSFRSEVYWSTQEKDLKVADLSSLPIEAFTSGELRKAVGFYRTHSIQYCELTVCNKIFVILILL